MKSAASTSTAGLPANPGLGSIVDYEHEVATLLSDFYPDSRRWLDAIVDDFRSDSGRRNLIIVGETGVGKSTYMAHLASKLECPRYFAFAPTEGQLAPGALTGDPRDFLIRVGRQLGQRYGPSVYGDALATMRGRVEVHRGSGHADAAGIEVEELFISPFRRLLIEGSVSAGDLTDQVRVAGVRVKHLHASAEGMSLPDLMREAFTDPLARIAEQHLGAIVVLVVDGLDAPPDGDGIRLGDVIPTADNLRVIMTSRPGQHLARFARSDMVALTETREVPQTDTARSLVQQNRDDARAYVAHVIESDAELASAISKRVSSDTYIDTVAARSDGNFLFLRYFFNALREDVGSGRYDLIEPAGVPRGLNEFYRAILLERVRRGQPDNRWEEVYLPVLGALAVAKEPVPIRLLAGFSGVETAKVASVVASIGQFLDELDVEGEVTHRVFHPSFSEFLLDPALNSDYPFETAALHIRVASHYRAGNTHWAHVEWGSVTEGYPFRNLAGHLKDARAGAKLYDLICQPWLEAQYARTLSHRAFAADVQLAASLAESESPPNLLQLMRCGLIGTTLATTASIVPEQALVVLVRESQADRALAIAELVREPEARFRAYLGIGNQLIDSGRSKEARAILREALAAGIAVGDQPGRATPALVAELARALVKIEDKGLLQASATFAEIFDVPPRAVAFAHLAAAFNSIGDQVNADRMWSEVEAIVPSNPRSRRTRLRPDLARGTVTLVSEVAEALAKWHWLERSSDLVTLVLDRVKAIRERPTRLQCLSGLAYAMAFTDKPSNVDILAASVEAGLDDIDVEIRAFDVEARVLHAMNLSGNYVEASRISYRLDEMLREWDATSEKRGRLAQGFAQSVLTVEAAWMAERLTELVGALLEAKLPLRAAEVAAKALTQVEQIQDLGMRAERINTLLSALARAPLGREAKVVIDRLLDVIEGIHDPTWRLALVEDVSAIWTQFGAEDQQLRIARIAHNHAVDDEPDFQVRAARILVNVGEVADARAIAKSIAQEPSRSEALEAVAMAQIHAGELEGAYQTTKLMATDGIVATTLADVAVAFSTAGKANAIRIASEALLSADRDRTAWTPFGPPERGMLMAEQIGTERSKVDALRAAADELAGVQRYDEALELADIIGAAGDVTAFAKTLASTAGLMASGGASERAHLVFDQAEGLVTVNETSGHRAASPGEQDDEDPKSHAADTTEFGESVRRAMTTGSFRSAASDWIAQVAAVRSEHVYDFTVLSYEESAVIAQSDIAVAMHASGMTKASRRLARQALKAAESLGDSARNDVVENCVVVLGDTLSGRQQALAAARQVEDPVTRAILLTNVARSFADHGAPARAADIAREARSAMSDISDDRVRAIELAWIASVLALAGDPMAATVASESVHRAASIQDEVDLASALLVIVPTLREANLESASKAAHELSQSLASRASSPESLLDRVQLLVASEELEAARALARSARADAVMVDPSPERTDALGIASQAAFAAGLEAEAFQLFAPTLVSAATGTRDELFGVLEQFAALTARNDPGLLAEMHRVVRDTDQWWQSAPVLDVSPS